MFDQPTVDAVRAHAARLKIEAAILFAVIAIESDGRTFELIKGCKEPLIRWEGHYFDQRLAGDERDEARRKGLASPRAGAIKNPASQVKRWEILRDASRINAQAAFESASYGIGQVMGAHWQRLGVRIGCGVGRQTVRALAQFKAAPDEAVGSVALQDVQEVRNATRGGGLLVLLTAARTEITEAAGHLLELDAQLAKTAANAMLAGASVIGVGLALYGLYGWWQSRQTEEGDVPA